MTALAIAIQAEQAADKAVAAYDSFLFSHSFNGSFDGFKADLLAADAADACAKAARLTNKAARNGSFNAQRAGEFRAIAA